LTDIDRPDLSRVDPRIKAYIESLEAELDRLQKRKRESAATVEEDIESTLPLEPSELPTTINIITITASGIAKRTPRHLYNRQRRGGMGIFDLDAPGDEPPMILTTADEGQSLLLFTNLARTFRVPVSSLPESQVRARGQSIFNRSPLQPGEHLVAALPDLVRGSIAMVSQRGMVRILRHHVFGEYMKPGTAMFDPGKFGPMAGACWTPGEGDLLIVTRGGHGIRYSLEKFAPQGGPGIRLEDEDVAVAITPVNQESTVFMISADGRGTIRSMTGFNPNKSAGGSGKIAINSENLVGAMTVMETDDIFLISRLSKIIRFMAAEVPVKEGVVQGVNCMSLRADEVVSLTTTGLLNMP
jgi:DNA gyrase subunit A